MTNLDLMRSYATVGRKGRMHRLKIGKRSGAPAPQSAMTTMCTTKAASPTNTGIGAAASSSSIESRLVCGDEVGSRRASCHESRHRQTRREARFAICGRDSEEAAGGHRLRSVMLPPWVLCLGTAVRMPAMPLVRVPAVQLSAQRPVRASPYALKALRDLALLTDQLSELRSAVQPAAEQGEYALSRGPSSELASLSSTLDAGTGKLSASLDSLAKAMRAVPTEEKVGSAEAEGGAGGAGGPASLKTLTLEASRLHQLVDEERQLIAILEEQESGTASRTRAAFDQIDADGNGELTFAEFEEGAKALLHVGATQDSSLRAEMEARFSSADTDKSGSLNYSEFVTLLQSLRGEALEPLRQAFTSGLQACGRPRPLALGLSPLTPRR